MGWDRWVFSSFGMHGDAHARDHCHWHWEQGLLQLQANSAWDSMVTLFFQDAWRRGARYTRGVALGGACSHAVRSTQGHASFVCRHWLLVNINTFLRLWPLFTPLPRRLSTSIGSLLSRLLGRSRLAHAAATYMNAIHTNTNRPWLPCMAKVARIEQTMEEEESLQ